MVVLQGPDKGNQGIESLSAVAKPNAIDPAGVDWLNYRSWDYFYVP